MIIFPQTPRSHLLFPNYPTACSSPQYLFKKKKMKTKTCKGTKLRKENQYDKNTKKKKPNLFCFGQLLLYMGPELKCGWHILMKKTDFAFYQQVLLEIVSWLEVGLTFFVLGICLVWIYVGLVCVFPFSVILYLYCIVSFVSERHCFLGMIHHL